MAVALVFKLASACKYTSSQEAGLGEGRCASGAMQGKRVTRGRTLRQRRIPGDDLRCAGEIKPGGCQRWHVQCLADVAGGIRPIRMLVEERAARRKKEQSSAGKHRQRAACYASSENG